MNLSKQDVQNVVENAKNRIMERMASKQEVQIMCDGARDRVMTYMQTLVQAHQNQLFNRENIHYTQTQRRIGNLEQRIASLDGEIKMLRRTIEQLAHALTAAQQQNSRMTMPLQPEQSATTPYTNYVFKSV